MEDEQDLSTNILPVDLNCLLYHLELTLGKDKEAEQRRQAVRKYMWSNDLNFFTDYNYIKREPTNRLTLAAVYSLWLNVSTKYQAENVARQIESLFLYDGGVVTTLSKKSTQQWDSPNRWTPLQYITYRALLQIPGYASLARIIRQRWMNINDGVNTNKPAGGGLYETQDGFGWTNEVYLAMLYNPQLSVSNSIRYQPIFLCLLNTISNLVTSVENKSND